MLERNAFIDLPKVELHLHLDCSPSYEFVKRFRPDTTPVQFQQDYALHGKCRDLTEFLARVPRCLDLLQEPDPLAGAVDDLMDQLAADGVVYAEIRFAPLLHTQKGLPPERVVGIVADRLASAVERTGVEANLILCTLRHFSQEMGLQTVALASQFRGQRVVGVDLAADEAGWPIDAHVRPFKVARDEGINRTAHAGEALGPESVRETLSYLAPSRIGHGVRSIEDPDLVNDLIEAGIHLEVCPSCNVLIDVFRGYPDHPVDRLKKAGVSLGINTDGRTVPWLTLTREYELLNATFGWGPEAFLQCNLAALNAAFIDEPTRQRLESTIRKGYASLSAIKSNAP